MRWIRRPEWVHRVSSGHVLLARRDGQKRTLGGLATTIWVVLNEPADRTQVLDRLADLAPEQAIDEGDVDAALEMLVDAEVIRAEPTGA